MIDQKNNLVVSIIKTEQAVTDGVLKKVDVAELNRLTYQQIELDLEIFITSDIDERICSGFTLLKRQLLNVCFSAFETEDRSSTENVKMRSFKYHGISLMGILDRKKLIIMFSNEAVAFFKKY